MIPDTPKNSEDWQLLQQQLLRTRDELSSLSREGYCKTSCRNYAYIVENAPVSVVITEANGNIEYVNPKFEDVSGYTLAEVQGKNPRILKSDETSPEEYSDLWRTILQGGEWVGTFHNRRKNGELFWERALISGIRDEVSGEISHFIAIKEDITDIREAEIRLEQEQLKTIHNSKMAEIGMLTSGILHEIGNPVASIRGLLCDIRDNCLENDNNDEFNAMIEQQLKIILDEIDRITGITRDLSEFSYSNQTSPDLIDLNEVIHNTCRLIKFDSRFKSIDLRLSLSGRLPAIEGFKDQLTQVLFNLLSNAAHAVEHLPDRVARVTVSTLYENNRIQLQVEDNGCGIEVDKLPHIFDLFFTDKELGKGTGLGLTLSRSIIEDHRGNIEIDSEIDKGTIVRITLPAKYGAPA